MTLTPVEVQRMTLCSVVSKEHRPLHSASHETRNRAAGTQAPRPQRQSHAIRECFVIHAKTPMPRNCCPDVRSVGHGRQESRKRIHKMTQRCIRTSCRLGGSSRPGRWGWVAVSEGHCVFLCPGILGEAYASCSMSHVVVTGQAWGPLRLVFEGQLQSIRAT